MLRIAENVSVKLSKVLSGTGELYVMYDVVTMPRVAALSDKTVCNSLTHASRSTGKKSYDRFPQLAKIKAHVL